MFGAHAGIPMENLHNSERDEQKRANSKRAVEINRGLRRVAGGDTRDAQKLEKKNLDVHRQLKDIASDQEPATGADAEGDNDEATDEAEEVDDVEVSHLSLGLRAA